MELGWYDEAAAEVFALVVFVSDGLLEIGKHDVASTSPAVRFVTIARQLPLELQMILCYLAVSSRKEIILIENSEVAFRDLARRFPAVPGQPRFWNSVFIVFFCFLLTSLSEF